MYHVIKADRTREPFSEQKVLASIKRARIPHHLQGEVLSNIKSKLYDGISTSSQPYTRSRYSLKESIMMLGPTGYPFEDFIAKLLENAGYQTKVRQILSGQCITHEIDVIAEKDGKTAIFESKFNNNPGTRSEVQTALYIQARF